MNFPKLPCLAPKRGVVVLGQQVLAEFDVPSVLNNIGDGLYQQSLGSDAPDLGAPCQSGFGDIVGDIVNP